jgi:hypothetical protein
LRDFGEPAVGAFKALRAKNLSDVGQGVVLAFLKIFEDIF